MKNLKLIFIFLAGILMFSACEKDKVSPVLREYPDRPIFVNPLSGGDYVLTEAAENLVMEQFAWTATNYGFPAATNYTLQIDFAGNDFDAPIDLMTTPQLGVDVIVGDLNSTVLAMGVNPGQPADFEVRVKSMAHEKAAIMYSNALSITVTPFEKIIIYPKLYVPGNYQGASGYGGDWSPDVAGQLTSLLFNDKYEGYVYMANGNNEFKFTDTPDWNNGIFGDSGGGTTGILASPGNNITLADAGYYKINVDIAGLTYTTLNTHWGLIGDATPTGWGSDTDMIYDPVEKTWSVTLDLVVGGCKFRANDGWDLNYGDNGPDGKLDAGGDNISISEAGNYTLTMDLSKGPYRYTVVKN